MIFQLDVFVFVCVCVEKLRGIFSDQCVFVCFIFRRLSKIGKYCGNESRPRVA
jgi:hypothetical protein